MMANTLICTLRRSSFLLYHSLTNNVNNYPVAVCSQIVRSLYSKATLGLDGFVSNKEKTQKQLENISDKFRIKMAEYANEDSKNMIFTEDLKNMIHIADSDDDINLVVKMMKRFNQQNKQLRFGNFIFGTVVMPFFISITNATLLWRARKCFKMPELSGFFDQLMSYQILLDLLFENKKYKEMLEVVNIITNRQIEGSKYPRNIMVLAFAACYKMNTPESLEYALKYWQELKNIGHLPMRRAVTFCAGLALNQEQPSVAMEILTLCKNQNYTTVRNMKVAALTRCGRVEDTIPILKSIISEDIPEDSVKHTFNRDVLEEVKNAITKLDNPEFTLEFNRITEIFQKQGQISETTLDSQLCQEIQKPPVMNSRQQQEYQRPRFNRNKDQRQPNRYNTYHQRPGLEELV
ncbi:hypothetical protein NQ317_011487 [Molorchus minor]|uniref:Pentatricopeptide repeat-containing protein 2 n=1 Tax=Molorchus minor TaxID=1323400 RepID=A0ABQ9IWG1_9CUCU|nr:hypothetical protein NQ317_011487 [Molorchus minor]